MESQIFQCSIQIFLTLILIQTVRINYIRLDEGEIIVLPASYQVVLSDHISNRMETISTLDLQSLASQTDPIKIIKLKQFAYNHSYEIGILFQLANKQYQVKSILNINETMSNGFINYQQTNSTFQMELDQDLKCIDFAFIFENTIQVLCFKDQIVLITLTLKEEINRIILEIPVNQEDQTQLFYYAEKQLSIILIESLEQETMLIFIKDNSLYKLLFLNQLAKSKNLKIIEIVLLRQFLTILTKQLIIQIDLKVERKYIYQSLNKFKQIQIIDNEAWVQTQDQEFLRFSEEMQQFVSVNNVDIDKIYERYNIFIVNDQIFEYSSDQIFLRQIELNYDIFAILQNINGLIIIKNTTITLYQISSISFIEMNKQLEHSKAFLNSSLQIDLLLNNDSMILNSQWLLINLPHKQILSYTPIQSGPYGIVSVHQDQLKILQTPQYELCLDDNYNFINYLKNQQEYSYWIVQQDYTLFFIVCQNQQQIQKLQVIVIQEILKELIYYYDNYIFEIVIILDDMKQYYKIQIISLNNNINDYVSQTQTNPELIITPHQGCKQSLLELLFNLQIQISVLSLNQFHAHFNNDTVYIYHNSFPFNDYKFEDSTILEILTLKFNHIVIILNDQFNETKLINYQLKDGKLIKLKEIPTFGYAFKSVFHIQKHSTLIVLLLENIDSNQYLAIYKLDLPKIDCQIGLIEYNPKYQYFFNPSEYVYVNFSSKSYQMHNYYTETYQIEFDSLKQGFTNHVIQFRIRNQLIDQIITTNVIIYDHSTKLMPLQDTLQIQYQSKIILPIQKLFYGFISNITCHNCQISFPFKFEEKFQINSNQQIIKKQLFLSSNYIIVLVSAKYFLLFDTNLEYITQLNHVEQNISEPIFVSSLTICDACFLFRQSIGIYLKLEVKQIVNEYFQTLFSQNILLQQYQIKQIFDIQDNLIITFRDFLDDKFSLIMYKFVLDKNNEIFLQIQQIYVPFKILVVLQFQVFKQQILIVNKVSSIQVDILVIDMSRDTQSLHSIFFQNFDSSHSLICHKLSYKNKFIKMSFSAFNLQKLFIFDVVLTQSVIQINLADPRQYIHLLIAKEHQYIQLMHYISEEIAVVQLIQSTVNRKQKIHQYQYLLVQ